MSAMTKISVEKKATATVVLYERSAPTMRPASMTTAAASADIECFFCITSSYKSKVNLSKVYS